MILLIWEKGKSVVERYSSLQFLGRGGGLFVDVWSAGGFFEDDVLVVDHMCSQLWGAVSATGKDNDLSWDYNGIMVEEKTT